MNIGMRLGVLKQTDENLMKKVAKKEKQLLKRPAAAQERDCDEDAKAPPRKMRRPSASGQLVAVAHESAEVALSAVVQGAIADCFRDAPSTVRLGVASREYDLVTSTDVVEQTFIAMISAINAAEGIASFPTQCDEVIPFMDAVGALLDALPAGLRLGVESGYLRLCFWPISIRCM